MEYSLSVSNKKIASYLYALLEVYWLSGSLGSIKFMKEFFGVSPFDIEIGGESYFLIKLEKEKSFGYYIKSSSLESLILNSINEEIKLGTLYLANKKSDDGSIDLLLHTVLLNIMNTFSIKSNLLLPFL